MAAEDDPVSRELLAAILERNGLQVDLAADGHEVVQMFDPARHALVLMDLRMAVVMDGFITKPIEACSLLKTLAAWLKTGKESRGKTFTSSV